MDQELLKTIAFNTRSKTSLQIVISGNTSSIYHRYKEALYLNEKGKFEIALVNLDTYYSFPNIDSTNNIFRYSADSGVTWNVIAVPEGSYELANINSYIVERMKLNNHYDVINDSPHISFEANTNTLKTVLNINAGYQVDFTIANSLRTVLGFDSQIFTQGYYESTNIVNIMSINSILINLDIINGSYVNGERTTTIYSFFPDVSPGYKIIEAPVNLVYLPLNTNKIETITMTVTDQKGNLLNTRGEVITARFHIREY